MNKVSVEPKYLAQSIKGNLNFLSVGSITDDDHFFYGFQEDFLAHLKTLNGREAANDITTVMSASWDRASHHLKKPKTLEWVRAMGRVVADYPPNDASDFFNAFSSWKNVNSYTLVFIQSFLQRCVENNYTLQLQGKPCQELKGGVALAGSFALGGSVPVGEPGEEGWVGLFGATHKFLIKNAKPSDVGNFLSNVILSVSGMSGSANAPGPRQDQFLSVLNTVLSCSFEKIDRKDRDTVTKFLLNVIFVRMGVLSIQDLPKPTAETVASYLLDDLTDPTSSFLSDERATCTTSHLAFCFVAEEVLGRGILNEDDINTLMIRLKTLHPLVDPEQKAVVQNAVTLLSQRSLDDQTFDQKQSKPNKISKKI